MILGVTGHRIDKLGYNPPNPIYNYVCQETEKIFKELKPDKIITGMAIGFDSYVAFIAHKLNIPFLAAVPFKNQEIKWPDKTQKTYHKLLALAAEVVIVSSGEYSVYKMQIRNQYIVDNSDIMLACFDGSPGGTQNCINYTKFKNKEIIYINPKHKDK